MNDTPISGQQVAQASAEPVQASTTEPTVQETKPLTDDQLRAIEAIATERATRIAQSLVDKASYRLSQEAQQKIDALRNYSKDFGLTDEQVRTKLQEIVTNDLTAQPQAAQASEPAPVQGGNGIPADANPFVQMVDDLFQEKGLKPDSSDPEFTEFLKAWNDPNGNAGKLVTAAISYRDSKAARLQKIEETSNLRAPGGSGGSTSGAPAAGNSSELWRQAYLKR